VPLGVLTSYVAMGHTGVTCSGSGNYAGNIAVTTMTAVSGFPLCTVGSEHAIHNNDAAATNAKADLQVCTNLTLYLSPLTSHL
jgi:hypothetical protein